LRQIVAVQCRTLRFDAVVVGVVAMRFGLNLVE
jgi:hypothetical protein